ncbi:Rieske 2Fe-2S domain-containing protein [Sulfurisphaera javensis]|uniref:Rieske 2Fe-2S domain-containing protein n=1 Tax=Sulfurisphaera javensis TaxID=2049879 RepID=A0AAT9GQI3_9CREN
MLTLVEIKGYPIMIYEKDGKKYMYLAGCPHKQRPITTEGYKIEEDTIVCPFHKAKFSLITGELIKPPESKTSCPPDCKLIRVDIIGNEIKFEKEPFHPSLPKK